MNTQTITLSGLTCPACKKITEKRIGGLDGVSKVETTIETGLVAIEASREISAQEINNVLKDTPYKTI
ncbi:MAG: heavy metal-associated domain-containing protein [Patescibacteria group bacterium]